MTKEKAETPRDAAGEIQRCAADGKIELGPGQDALRIRRGRQRPSRQRALPQPECGTGTQALEQRTPQGIVRRHACSNSAA